MTVARNQHYLLRQRTGDLWHIYPENSLLKYKVFPQENLMPPTGKVLIDGPVLDYDVSMDNVNNLHVICLMKSGQMNYYIGKPDKTWNSTTLAEVDLKSQMFKYLTLKITSKRVHIFWATANVMNNFLWTLLHSYWNGKKWVDTQIGEIVAGKHVPAFNIDQDSQDNLHFLYVSAMGGKSYEPYYKKYNSSFDLWGHTEQIPQMPENCHLISALVDWDDNLHLVCSGTSGNKLKQQVSYLKRNTVTRHDTGWGKVLKLSKPVSTATYPVIFLKDQMLFTVFNEQKIFYLCKSRDQGESWSEPEPVDKIEQKLSVFSYRSMFAGDMKSVKVPLIYGTHGQQIKIMMDDILGLVPKPLPPSPPQVDATPPQAGIREKPLPACETQGGMAGKQDGKPVAGTASPEHLKGAEAEPGGQGEEPPAVKEPDEAGGPENREDVADVPASDIKVLEEQAVEEQRTNEWLDIAAAINGKMEALESSLEEIRQEKNLLDQWAEKMDGKFSVMRQAIEAFDTRLMENMEKYNGTESAIKGLQGDLIRLQEEMGRGFISFESIGDKLGQSLQEMAANNDSLKKIMTRLELTENYLLANQRETGEVFARLNSMEEMVQKREDQEKGLRQELQIIKKQLEQGEKLTEEKIEARVNDFADKVQRVEELLKNELAPAMMNLEEQRKVYREGLSDLENKFSKELKGFKGEIQDMVESGRESDRLEALHRHQNLSKVLEEERILTGTLEQRTGAYGKLLEKYTADLQNLSELQRGLEEKMREQQKEREESLIQLSAGTEAQIKLIEQEIVKIVQGQGYFEQQFQDFKLFQEEQNRQILDKTLEAVNRLEDFGARSQELEARVGISEKGGLAFNDHLAELEAVCHKIQEQMESLAEGQRLDREELERIKSGGFFKKLFG